MTPKCGLVLIKKYPIIILYMYFILHILSIDFCTVPYNSKLFYQIRPVTSEYDVTRAGASCSSRPLADSLNKTYSHKAPVYERTVADTLYDTCNLC